MILASHSRLSIPPETWYLLRLPAGLSENRTLTPTEVDQVTQIMTRHYRWADMDLNADEFRAAAAGLKNPSLREVIEIVYRKHLEKDRKVRWGDKTPGYIEMVPRLTALFPEAQYIHFIRDGRDVAKSFQAKKWHGQWLHDNAREWIEAMDYNSRWVNSPLSSRILQVRYEDLVSNTEMTIRKICDFLGEKFEPQMLSWHDRVDALVPVREREIHRRLKQTPGSDDVSRWKREMSKREILIAEAFMGRHLRALGYELHFGGALWAPVFGLTRWYCRHLLPIVSLPLRAMRFLRNRLPLRPNVGDTTIARDDL
jgi:hypothetical protein